MPAFSILAFARSGSTKGFALFRSVVVEYMFAAAYITVGCSTAVLFAIKRGNQSCVWVGLYSVHPVETDSLSMYVAILGNVAATSPGDTRGSFLCSSVGFRYGLS